ncbi:hypothetical protein ACJ72_08041 [Emergomyces africanus]|uniref:Rhodopsin domain-containing protein n=1 Tax=Emergomyces africanus TaxID=1955775 RepID=A0A1B7NLK3_9EURO|nr:hypothetical protein ACJ72_08041 [Emergomyces africanus]
MEEKSCSIFAVAISFLVVSWATVALRCYVRLKMTRWGVDDIFVIVALLIFTGFTICLMHSASMGLGKHTKDIKSVDKIIESFKFFFTADLLYILSSGIVKISFCLSLLRIVIVGRAYIYTIYTVGIVTAIFTIFYFFFALFSCWPVEYTWEQIRNPDSGGTCRQYFKVVAGSYAHGSIICAGDLVLAIVPALMIRKLQLNRRTKISASILLGFGSVASVATIARLPYVKYGYNQVDFLYANTEIMIWAMVEIGVSITAISAVTLKPLPTTKKNYNRQHRSSTHGMISSSGLRPENTITKGRSSEEENIWISKADGQTIPSRDGIEDDLELIPRGQIQKVVEFSASRDPEEPNQHSISDSEPEHRPKQTEHA